MIPLMAAAGALEAAGKVADAVTAVTKAMTGKNKKEEGVDGAISFAALMASHYQAGAQKGVWHAAGSDTNHSHGHTKPGRLDQVA